jgi:acetyl esterase/lipase
MRMVFSAICLLLLSGLLGSCSSEADTVQLEVESEQNVPYSSGNVLDIYSPVSDGPWPIVIAFHGGETTKSSLRGLSEAIASHGATVFAANWPSNPPAADDITYGWDEASCVLSYAQEYAEIHGAVKKTIIIGHSAGGAVGFVMAVAANEFSGDCVVEINPIEVDGFIGLDGAYRILDHVPESSLKEGNPELWDRINPFYYLDDSSYRSDLNILLMVGNHSGLQAEANQFQEELVGSGYRVSRNDLPDVSHQNMVGPYPETLKLILEMLRTD